MLYGIVFKVFELANGTPAAVTAAFFVIGADFAIKVLGEVAKFVIQMGKMRLIRVGHKATPVILFLCKAKEARLPYLLGERASFDLRILLSVYCLCFAPCLQKVDNYRFYLLWRIFGREKLSISERDF